MNKKIAIQNDNKVYDLAMYEVTKGQTLKMDNEVLFSLTLNKFMEFKRLVIRKEFTLEQLEQDIYGKYGIMEETPLEALRNMTDELMAKENTISKEKCK